MGGPPSIGQFRQLPTGIWVHETTYQAVQQASKTIVKVPLTTRIKIWLRWAGYLAAAGLGAWQAYQAYETHDIDRLAKLLIELAEKVTQ